jgi:PPOX class probable F420-dependent enzyme
MVGLDGFESKKYLSLETYRKNGAGVRTPVWFAAAPEATGRGKLYVYSTADSGKAKRIRRTSVAKVAPCDARGKVTGAWVSVRASIVGGGEFDRGMVLLDRKYWPVKQMLDLLTLLSPRGRLPQRGRVMIAIQPV